MRRRAELGTGMLCPPEASGLVAKASEVATLSLSHALLIETKKMDEPLHDPR